MKNLSQTCSHSANRQAKTKHGHFCLDCGKLIKTNATSNKVVRQHLAHSISLATAVGTESDHIKHPAVSPTKISKTISISMADIRPKTRKRMS